ncbi:MAG: glutamine synthetase [DPANN group archaeon]|nr:glutamine synthetase [DPANN group archaeon]
MTATLTKEDVLRRVTEDNVKFINLQFTDIHGMVKNVTIPVGQLEKSLTQGTWFDGSSIEGFTRIQESDQLLRPDPSTYAVIPWMDSEERSARLICDIYMPDGKPFEGDPRYILKRALAKAKSMGYKYYTGPELEFFLFRKDNGHVEPLPHDRGSYFDLSLDNAYEVRQEMMMALEKFGIEVEASHHEVAAGQHEIDFKYDDALRTADNAVTLKATFKAIAQRHGLHITFMPKPIAGVNGSGMHVHQSLWDIKEDRNAFYDAKDPYRLSSVAKSFIAGQLSHIKEIAAVTNPLVNSYKRLVPGYEASTYICWAQRNRTALIRIPKIIEGKGNAARAEIRCPDPASNPYLVFALLLEAGLKGIRESAIPPEPAEEDVFEYTDEMLRKKGIDYLPYSLWQAIEKMSASELAKQTLGEHTFGRYLAAKTQEWDAFRVSVTDWEKERYLELY